VTDQTMFYCIPQQAYMRTDNCRKLRKRPVGKVPAGAQPRLRACETCTLFPLVEQHMVPMVSLNDYLQGSRPRQANLKSSRLKKAIEAYFAKEAV